MGVRSEMRRRRVCNEDQRKGRDLSTSAQLASSRSHPHIRRRILLNLLELLDIKRLVPAQVDEDFDPSIELE